VSKDYDGSVLYSHLQENTNFKLVRAESILAEASMNPP